MKQKVRVLNIRNSDKGFSLVEALVGAALVALAFMAISNLFPTGYSNITYGGNQSLATNYAQQKIEQLKDFSFDAINVTNCSNVCENLGNGICRYCLLVTNVGVGSLAGDLKKVQVRVTFPGQFRPGAFSAETIFTR